MNSLEFPQCIKDSNHWIAHQETVGQPVFLFWISQALLVLVKCQSPKSPKIITVGLKVNWVSTQKLTQFTQISAIPSPVIFVTRSWDMMDCVHLEKLVSSLKRLHDLDNIASDLHLTVVLTLPEHKIDQASQSGSEVSCFVESCYFWILKFDHWM